MPPGGDRKRIGGCEVAQHHGVQPLEGVWWSLGVTGPSPVDTRAGLYSSPGWEAE